MTAYGNDYCVFILYESVIFTASLSRVLLPRKRNIEFNGVDNYIK